MPEIMYLREAEFTRWATAFDERLGNLESTAQQNAIDIAVMKAAGVNSTPGVSKSMTSVISAIVAGLISGIVAYAQSGGSKP